MLEEVMDDQEDVGDINLSSRPKREERRRQRNRRAPNPFAPVLSRAACLLGASRYACTDWFRYLRPARLHSPDVHLGQSIPAAVLSYMAGSVAAKSL